MYRNTIKELSKMSFGLKRTIINQVKRLKNKGGRRLANCAVNSLLIHTNCGDCVHGFPYAGGTPTNCAEYGLKGLLK